MPCFGFMNIETIARKLEPLMPEQIKYWLKVRDTADPDLKGLIEKQIISAAYKRLGDFRTKLLLSLPPRQKVRGQFHLGTILYEQEKWPVSLLSSELLQHMAIFGRSGAGKTNIALHILEQLVNKKIPFLFLDWKRTARHLIPKLKKKINIYTPGRSLSGFVFNPFIVPPGLEPSVYINLVVDVIAEAYTLGDGSRSILQKALAACYKQGNHSPTVAELIQEVEKTELNSRTRGWKTSALRALESLSFSDVTATDKVSQEEITKKLLQENTIIELDALSHNTKKFLIPMLWLWVYHVKLASKKREELDLIIFIEEAHHVLYKQEHRSKESLINMLLRQCREIGIGIIIIDQHPHLISSAALGNSYTSICLNQKDPTDINKAAALSLVDDEDKKHFSMLPVGQGVVKLQDRWRKPFLVRFPLVDIQKGLVSDEYLKKYVNSTGSDSRRLVSKEFGQVPQVHFDDKPLNKGAFALIQDIIEHQDDGVKARYKRMNISAGKGNRLKEELIAQGWLEDQIVELGKTRKVLLRLTKKARQIFRIETNNLENNSLVHEYWKRFYAHGFQEQGYNVYLEAPRISGRVDLLARKGNQSIAIEVETGKSNAVWNVKQNLLSKFDKILVVATDKTALNKVEQQLGKAGLIIPEKIEIVLRDGFCFEE